MDAHSPSHPSTEACRVDCICDPFVGRNTLDLVHEGFKTLDHDSPLLVHPYIHPHPLALIIGVIPLLGVTLRPVPCAQTYSRFVDFKCFGASDVFAAGG